MPQQAGRYIAEDRGAFLTPDEQGPHLVLPDPEPAQGPILQRLDAESLLSLANFSGLALSDFLNRYTA